MFAFFQGGLEDVTFWADVEAYKGIPVTKPKAVASRAKAIFRTYKFSQTFAADPKEVAKVEHFAPTFEQLEEAQLAAEERIASGLCWMEDAKDDLSVYVFEKEKKKERKKKRFLCHRYNSLSPHSLCFCSFFFLLFLSSCISSSLFLFHVLEWLPMFRDLPSTKQRHSRQANKQDLLKPDAALGVPRIESTVEDVRLLPRPYSRYTGVGLAYK